MNPIKSKMKQKPIYTLCLAISLFCISLQAQNDSIQLEASEMAQELQDDLKQKNPNRVGNFFIGADLFQPIVSGFGDRKGAVFMASYRVYKKWNAVLEVGFDKNIYDEHDWNMAVEGMYYKLGFNWFISQDAQNLSNGFYTGLRFAYADYDQTVRQYPIRLSDNQVGGYGALPTARVSAYWLELVAGARVHLLHNFYADISFRPEIYIGSKKQENIDPLVIPGYGKDIGPINFNVFWGLTYQLF